MQDQDNFFVIYHIIFASYGVDYLFSYLRELCFSQRVYFPSHLLN